MLSYFSIRVFSKPIISKFLELISGFKNVGFFLILNLFSQIMTSILNCCVKLNNHDSFLCNLKALCLFEDVQKGQ